MSLTPSSGWSHYKRIVISDNANVSADYQMKLTVYAGSGTDDPSDGIIYCDNNCSNFPDDIRFGTTNDPLTADQLSQWIEEYDSTSAIFWVKLPNDGSDTIYMFVGNSTANQYNNGDDTFIFFDHFDGTNLDSEKWTSVGDISVSESEIILTGTESNNAYVKSKDTFSYNTRIRAKWKYTSIDTGSWLSSVGYNAFATGTDAIVSRSLSGHPYYEVATKISFGSSLLLILLLFGWIIWEIKGSFKNKVAEA